MNQNKKIFNNIKLKKQEKILLKVKAGAKHNTIDDVVEIDHKKYFKISIKAIPENGKANKMIIEFLAKEWNIPKKDLEILGGKTSQYKVLRIKW